MSNRLEVIDLVTPPHTPICIDLSEDMDVEYENHQQQLQLQPLFPNYPTFSPEHMSSEASSSHTLVPTPPQSGSMSLSVSPDISAMTDTTFFMELSASLATNHYPEPLIPGLSDTPISMAECPKRHAPLRRLKKTVKCHNFITGEEGLPVPLKSLFVPIHDDPFSAVEREFGLGPATPPAFEPYWHMDPLDNLSNAGSALYSDSSNMSLLKLLSV